MDPITVGLVVAGIQLADHGIVAWTEFYKGLTPEQRVTYNQPFVDAMKFWTETGKAFQNLIHVQ